MAQELATTQQAANASVIPAPFQGMSRLPFVRQVGLLIGLAASVALGGAVIMWSQTPNYRLLYGNISERDVSQVADALTQSNIQYKIDPSSGGIMVAEKQLYDARIKLAAQGLPQSAREGFEVMEQGNGFGTSQFMETARYQRALEGELVRTISSIRSVEGARVHLALPKQSLFLRERQRPSASVFVKLFPGRQLDRGQVAAIVHMVAASISDLDAERVTVVDNKGKLLTSKDSSESGLSFAQFGYANSMEEAYIRRIEDLLAPIVGLNSIKAKVAADMDFTLTEQTQESFSPASNAVRSEHVVEETTVSGGGGATAFGVPGALSNQPPAAGVAPEVAAGRAVPDSAPAIKASPENTSRVATRNFELDRTISHTRTSPGRLRRLSVAVVVDYRLDAQGQVAPRTPEEMERITALVREAVGFNGERGDTVQVVNTPFAAVPEVEPLPESPIWEQPWVWDVAKQIAGAIGVLLLVFGVLRPVMRSLASKQAAVSPSIEHAALAGPHAGMQMQAYGAPANSYESQLETAKSLVTQDPKLVAQVVKNWVGSDA